jgi:hypothetical protein
VSKRGLQVCALAIGAAVGAVVALAPAAEAASTTVPWHETPVVTCDNIWIDPPATFTVTFHGDIDGTPFDTLASWGTHADPYIAAPAALEAPGPHHVHVHATATVSNIPGAVATSNAADVDITCVEMPTTTTTSVGVSSTTSTTVATPVTGGEKPIVQVGGAGPMRLEKAAVAGAQDELPRTGGAHVCLDVLFALGCLCVGAPFAYALRKVSR